MGQLLEIFNVSVVSLDAFQSYSKVDLKKNIYNIPITATRAVMNIKHIVTNIGQLWEKKTTTYEPLSYSLHPGTGGGSASYVGRGERRRAHLQVNETTTKETTQEKKTFIF